MSDSLTADTNSDWRSGPRKRALVQKKKRQAEQQREAPRDAPRKVLPKVRVFTSTPAPWASLVEQRQFYSTIQDSVHEVSSRLQSGGVPASPPANSPPVKNAPTKRAPTKRAPGKRAPVPGGGLTAWGTPMPLERNPARTKDGKGSGRTGKRKGDAKVVTAGRHAAAGRLPARRSWRKPPVLTYADVIPSLQTAAAAGGKRSGKRGARRSTGKSSAHKAGPHKAGPHKTGPQAKIHTSLATATAPIRSSSKPNPPRTAKRRKPTRMKRIIFHERAQTFVRSIVDALVARAVGSDASNNVGSDAGNGAPVGKARTDPSMNTSQGGRRRRRRRRAGGPEMSSPMGKFLRAHRPRGLDPGYREFCRQLVTPALNARVSSLLEGLSRLQHRAHVRNPIKAASRRRFVCGLREVGKALRTGKLRHLVCAPAVESVKAQGGLDELLRGIFDGCEAKGVAVTFALNRKTMGLALGKKSKVTACGILDPSGCNEEFDKVCELTLSLAEQWQMFHADTLYKPDALRRFLGQTPSPASGHGASTGAENSAPTEAGGRAREGMNPNAEVFVPFRAVQASAAPPSAFFIHPYPNYLGPLVSSHPYGLPVPSFAAPSALSPGVANTWLGAGQQVAQAQGAQPLPPRDDADTKEQQSA